MLSSDGDLVIFVYLTVPFNCGPKRFVTLRAYLTPSKQSGSTQLTSFRIRVTFSQTTRTCEFTIEYEETETRQD